MIIFVVGYMASGKTTFGRALAEKLGVNFIDLDQYIEETSGAKIPEIFKEKGEAGFRELEKEMLHSSVENAGNSVIACGGGTPCYFDNMEFLNNNGITVFLEASTPVLISRLQAENQSRPLMADKTDDEIQEKVLTQLCERLPFYMESKLKWHGDDLETPEEIETNVSNFISTYPSLFRDLGTL
ncbi:MAG: shikimate kinase [Muribaculaceae bacterium]|nr:shikimate kinase [Muribaculaceae bacterium]